MRNKLGKRVMTMALAMILTFASCVTVFAQMGTDGDEFVEETEYYKVYKTASENDAGKLVVYASIGWNDRDDSIKTMHNDLINEVLTKDYFIEQSTLFTHAEFGKISAENMSTMLEKRVNLKTYTKGDKYRVWTNIDEVTNADSEYDPTVKYEDTEAVTNKLKAAGYTGFSMQFHTVGTGRLPGATGFAINDEEPKNPIATEKSGYADGTAYLYYYDSVTDSFVLVDDDAEYHSANFFLGMKRNSFSSEHYNATKHGAYVYTTEKIADSAVKKVDVSVSADTKFSTKDYVGNAMEVATKNGGWYFTNVTDAVDFDPSFEVGKKLEKVSKKLESVDLSETLKYTTVDFAFSGVLPGVANVTVRLDNAGFTEDSTVYLYYYNPDKNIFELVCDAAYKNGEATFEMTHCSEYIVTNEKLSSDLTTAEPVKDEPANKPGDTTNKPGDTANKPGDTTNKPGDTINVKQPSALTSVAPKTGDTTNAVPFVLALVLGCAVIAVVVVRKRTVK